MKAFSLIALASSLLVVGLAALPTAFVTLEDGFKLASRGHRRTEPINFDEAVEVTDYALQRKAQAEASSRTCLFS